MRKAIFFCLISCLLIIAGCEETSKSCSREDRLRSNYIISCLDKLYDTISFNRYRIWLDTEDEAVFKSAIDISSWNWALRDTTEKYCQKEDWTYLDTDQCTLDGIISSSHDSLFFKLLNGNTLRFKSRRTFSGDSLLYAYRGHFDNKTWFVFNNLYQDRPFCELINYKNGQRYTMHSMPSVAPKNKWLITSGTRFKLCLLSDNAVETVFDSMNDLPETELNIKWISANEALLEYRNDIFSRYARLVIK